MRPTADKIPIRNRRAARVPVLLALAAMLLFAAPAMAQTGDPTSAQYKDEATQISEDVGDGGGGGTTSSQPPDSGLHKEVVGGLPFTGLDLIALAAVAIALTSMGFALRRLTVDHNRV